MADRGVLDPDKMFEIKLLFLREMERGYRDAREAQEQFLRAPDDRAAAEKVQRFFHQIAGTAGAVQMPLIGRLAGVLDGVARSMLASAEFDAKALAQAFADGLAGVAHALDAHGSGPIDRPLDTTPDLGGLSVPDGVNEGRELSKILVIDDDRFSAGLIDSTLRSAGFVSSFCCDPEQAVEIIEEELPDLIILDVVMPAMDGFELCRRVRAHPALQFTPIIFVTRKGDLEERVRGLEVGGNDYISKPFEPQELIARVRSHLLRLANLREMAIRDGLTRCFNHKFFRMRIEQEVSRARRYDHPLAVAMIDVDDFKKINDTHGHAAGDLVLAHLSNIILASLRSTDVVARYGGEEFAVLMVQAGAQEADIVCNRLRERIADHDFSFMAAGALESVQIPTTVSIGVAQLAPGSDTWNTLLQRADRALYEAKNTGKNRVVISAAITDGDLGTPVD